MRVLFLFGASLFLASHFGSQQNAAMAAAAQTDKKIKCRDKCLRHDGFFKDSRDILKPLSQAYMIKGFCRCTTSPEFHAFLKEHNKSPSWRYKSMQYVGLGNLARKKGSLKAVTAYYKGSDVLGFIAETRKQYEGTHPEEEYNWEKRPLTSFCEGDSCGLLKSANLPGRIKPVNANSLKKHE